MRWYKRDPDAALAGMIGLSLEERGVYNTIIDLLYSRDGELPTSDSFFSKACGCRPQVWRRIRDSLLAKAKLHYRPDGKLTANRVVNELKTARKLMANRQQTGSKQLIETPVSSGKPNNINSSKQKPQTHLTPVHAREQPQPQPQRDDDSADARATPLEKIEPLIPPEAISLANEIAVIAGIDPKHPPPSWCGAAHEVAMWLREGWTHDAIVVGATKGAGKSRDGPIFSVRFFKNEIAREVARRKQPLPVVQVQPQEIINGGENGKYRNGSYSNAASGKPNSSWSRRAVDSATIASGGATPT